MNIRIKRLLTFYFIIAIFFINSFNVLGEIQITTIDKDETVYAFLENNGVIKNISVVNRITNIKDKTTVDFGSYKEINLLRKSNKPKIYNERILLDTKNYIDKDYYYEGTIEKELPINIEIQYYFNNKKIEANELTGKAGKIDIEIEITQNEKCDDVYTDLYMTQIQLSFNLDDITILENKLSNDTITGKIKTLSYMILPDENKKFKISLEAKKFELEPITIALLRYDIDFTRYTELVDGFEDITEGMETLANGGNDLESGFNEITNGFKTLNSGINTLYSNSKKYKDGLTSYQNGLKMYENGIDKSISGINQIPGAVGNLHQGSIELNQGYKGIKTGLDKLALGNDEMTVLANGLLDSEDPLAKALAEAVLAENKGLHELSLGLSEINKNNDTFNTGLEEFSTGIINSTKEFSTLKDGFSTLNTSFSKLLNGYSKLLDGLYEYKSGFNTFNREFMIVPTEIKKLTTGQFDLYSGISEFNTQIGNEFSENKDTKPVISFSDRNIEIKSLQFIMKTKGITIPKVEDNSVVEKNEKSFFQNLLSKFTELFN